MNIKSTSHVLQELVKTSETLKEQFASMVLLAPQVLEEDELKELREKADIIATNFDSCASWLANFGRQSPGSKFYSPNGRVNNNNQVEQ